MLVLVAAFWIKRACRLIGDSVSVFWVFSVIFNDKGCLGEGVQNFFEVVLLLLKCELLHEGLFEVGGTVGADQANDNQDNNCPNKRLAGFIVLAIVSHDELQA